MEIANNINPMIQLTVEMPCNFNDGKLPVLDVVVNTVPLSRLSMAISMSSLNLVYRSGTNL